MRTPGTGEDRVVVVLSTDVVGSTLLNRGPGDDDAGVLRRTLSGLREVIASTGGRELKTPRDGLMVAFSSPLRALRCAVEMQRAVARQNRQDPSRAVEIRIGLHLGDPPPQEADHAGTSAVVARRLRDRAVAGQILASALLAKVNGGGYRFRRLGRLHLTGLSEPVDTVAVEWAEPTAVDQAALVQTALRWPSRSPVSRWPRLAGRSDELAVLEAELARASAGEFRCVVILGDAGIGKTRLANEFVDRSQGVLVLSARAFPFGQTTSFGLWSEALERHLRALPGYEVLDLCGGFLDDLALLLRSAAAARGAAPQGETPLLRLMDGLAALLANLAQTSPVVITFDDVHLADQSSWEALQYLAYNLADAPVLVVACARPVELGEHPSAGPAVRGLEQDGRLRRLIVPPVEPTILAELCQDVVGIPPPEGLVRWVAERSRGNPLFALELVRALLDEDGDLCAPRLRQLPEGLTERVAGRLAHLDVEAAEAAEVLAVVARPLGLDELALINGRSLDDTAGIVHRLSASGLVGRAAEPDGGAELTHPLLQEVIYDRIPLSRRRTLHRLAARSLLASGRLAEAASHFVRCAHIGDVEAVDALRDALRQAEERQANPEALDILTALVDLLPTDDERWSEVVEAFPPGARWTVDHRVEVDAAHAARGLRALRVLESVLARIPDRARQATVKHRLGAFFCWGLGDPQESARLLTEARDLFESAGDTPSAVITSGTIAYVYALAANRSGMEAEAARAMRTAEALGQPLLASGALAALFRTAGMAARFQEAESYGEDLVVLVRKANDTAALSWILSMRALFRVCEGRVREVGPLLDEVKSLPQISPRALLVGLEPLIHWMAGDVPRARDCADRYRALNPGSSSPRQGIFILFSALVALEADRPEEAEESLSRARLAVGTPGFSYFTLSLEHIAALVAHRKGRTAAAVTQLMETSRRLLADGIVVEAVLTLLDQAELASSQDADPEAAREAADRLEQLAGDVDSALYGGYAAFGRACAELRAKQFSAARPPVDEALAVFSELGYQIFEGRALVVLGRALAHTDRPAAARAFQRAVATFDASGAVWRRDQTRGLLRALGGQGRKRAAAGAGPDALTRREREVARLAAMGHTARQIADALFVGERTVEGHLASVYSKLGISSRVDLARRAQELGL